MMLAKDADAKVVWMRLKGVTHATWNADGDLLGCTLGVEPGDPKPFEMPNPNPEPTDEEILLMSS